MLLPGFGVVAATIVGITAKALIGMRGGVAGDGLLDGITTLAELVASCGAEFASGIGVNLWSSHLDAKDDGLNHDLEAAHGEAIARVIERCARDPARKGVAKDLRELAKKIRAAHQPHAIHERGAVDLQPIDLGAFVAAGFVDREVCTESQWRDYLHGRAHAWGLRLERFTHTLDVVSQALVAEHGEQFFGVLKADAATKGKAFASVLLRQTNTVLSTLRNVESTTDATWRIAKKVRERVDRIALDLEQLVRASADPDRHRAALTESLNDFSQKLDAITAQNRVTHEKLDGLHEKVESLAHKVAPPLPRGASNIEAARLPVRGRDRDLQWLEQRFDDPSRACVVVLGGPPGVGKSTAAREYARQNTGKYPGGTFFVDAGSGVAVGLAAIGAQILRLTFPPDFKIPDQAAQTFFALGREPTLLVYDNVHSLADLGDLLPAVEMRCHVLITTVQTDLDPAFPRRDLEPLAREDALRLVADAGGDEVARADGAALVARFGGFPIQLAPRAATIRLSRKRGLRIDTSDLAPEAQRSFAAPFDAVGSKGQTILHALATFLGSPIPHDEVRLVWNGAFEGDDSRFEVALSRCFDVHLVEGRADGDLRMHRVHAEYVITRGQESEDSTRIRDEQIARFTDLAKTLVADPARSDLARRFLAYPTTTDAWKWLGSAIPTNGDLAIGAALLEQGKFDDARAWSLRAVEAAEKGDVHGRVEPESLGCSFHQVGYCHSSLGQFEQALPWFQRAVEAAEKGDVHGRVDHQNLGRSLHQVGYCHASLGQFEQALPWFQRAVEAAEKGDVHGRIDHDCLGRSFHQVGYCHASLGQFEQALPWFQRAVEAKEKGDVHGRVDHESLGISLHLIGDCHASLGQFEQALPWFQRAVEAKEKGDVHGRVDHQSLGISLHEVGDCHSRLGQFEQALPWLQRAVEAKEKGDVHGRVDHQSLGTSLHQGGYCHSSLGQFEQALPWFQRAVEAKEKGDVHGRVDHQSLGTSLHQGGYCHSSLGHFAQALPWFQRAVEAKEKGDVHGRVDHQNLGRSLHQVGYCDARLGHFEQAIPWFQRAVEAEEKGGIHGRVDHQRLALSLDATATVLVKLGRPTEAASFATRAAAARAKTGG